MNQFKEKNWLFLNKLNNECNIAKNIYSAKAMNANDNKEFNDEYDIKLNKTQNQIKRMDSIEKNKNNINNLMTEIENIKKAIQVEEQKEIYSYGTKFKRRAGPRKFTQLASISNLISKVNNSNSAVNNINQSNSIKKKFVRQSTLKVQTPKNIFGMKKRLSILKNNNNNINKNINKRKSDFNLITEVNKKSKNLNNFRNSIFSFDKKIYCPINIKVPGSEKIKKDLNSYFEKYTQKYGDEVLTDSNIDLLKKIGETRRIIKKKDILGIHNNFFSYSRKHYKRAKLLEKLEKRLCNLDKYFVKQTVMKSFDNTYT